MYTYAELAKEVLMKATYPLTSKEIWEQAVADNLDKKLSSIGKTPGHTVGARIYTDIRDNINPEFMIALRQPTRFWLVSRASELSNIQIENIEVTSKNSRNKGVNNTRAFHERDLHPLLVRFIKDKFDAHSKTIYHEKSKKGQSGEDKWNFPDIVSVHFPFNDYRHEETLVLAQNVYSRNFTIYSFELKVRLDFSNLKESYFQAVSNSSFANEGYLVVFEDIDTEVLEDLQRLRESFGIGVIKLESEPFESQVILPAMPRSLDFRTIDMLVEKNKDFKCFIENLNKDIKVNDKDRIAFQHYDKIYSDEKLEEYLKDKKIIVES